jgi:hypothetical protein
MSLTRGLTRDLTRGLTRALDRSVAAAAAAPAATPELGDYTLRNSGTVTAGAFSLQGIWAPPEGDYIVGSFATGSAGDIRTHLMSTAHDLKTVSTSATDTFSVGTPSAGVFISTDGLKMYVCCYNIDSIRQYSLSPAFDITSATLDTSFSVAADGSDIPLGLHLSLDGTKMYVADSTDRDVYEYTLTTPWDLEGTVTFEGFFDTGQSVNGVTVSEDGLRMLRTRGSTSNTFRQYNMDPAFDITTCADSGLFVNGVSGYSIDFTDNDDRIYLCSNNGSIQQYKRYTGEGDEHWDKVVLLLDFAGADGATDITDLSGSAHVETFVDNAQVDDDLQYLAVNSLLLDGTDDVITFPDSVDWDFGTGDFTVEIGLRVPSPTSTQCILGNYDGVSEGSLLQLSSTNIIWYNFTALLTVAHGLSANTWHHIAVSRTGSTLKMFRDGVEIGSVTDASDYSGSANAFVFGALPSSTSTQNVTGNIGAVRITKGAGRYPAAFTAPTEFYPTS